MPDDLGRKAPEDPNTINTSQEWELDYWAKKWGVTKEQIKAAVKVVGNSTAKVKTHLKV